MVKTLLALLTPPALPSPSDSEKGRAVFSAVSTLGNLLALSFQNSAQSRRKKKKSNKMKKI